MGGPHLFYGTIWAPPLLRQQGKRYVRATVAAWEMAYGPVPPGLSVLHNCPTGDNTLCVNFIGHLWLGTPAANVHDMMQKGRDRYPQGSERPNAKIAEEDVLKICALRGQMSQQAIGAAFGLTQTIIGDIHRGKRWRHVLRPGPPVIPQPEQVAKLTRQDVYRIRRLQGNKPERTVAAEFGISRAQVGRIWRRECWAWLPDAEPAVH